MPGFLLIKICDKKLITFTFQWLASLSLIIRSGCSDKNQDNSEKMS